VVEGRKILGVLSAIVSTAKLVGAGVAGIAGVLVVNDRNNRKTEVTCRCDRQWLVKTDNDVHKVIDNSEQYRLEFMRRNGR